ncbi:phosphofurin acidic cluster sorting protein 2-like isoform X3 [Tubulanus polymorphus]|uniref:phosphofurin acidic cluster sorting protein 2-like isoform X3 n=1 Tax=Tubulanus polymorphus TaxID=672921 RepID=UPI003DA45FCD
MSMKSHMRNDEGRKGKMADRTVRQPSAGTAQKPVPMKLFATWEVEKSSPSCIPRLCSLTLTRLIVLKPLDSDLTSVTLAVKMQSSKRTLRSNEIVIPPNGFLDTELDLSFSLQYPHFLKRDGNKLHIMLQRRKRYKNRTILGYKTLAVGQINMSQVLQQSVDPELNLYSDLKERSALVAQLKMLSVTSQPVDPVDNGRKRLRNTDADRSPDQYSDDDDAHDYNDDDNSSNDDSDLEDDDTRARPRKPSRGPPRAVISRGQRNIKERFVALLRKLKFSEEVLDSEQDQDLADSVQNQQAIEDLLFAELEGLSDSGGSTTEMDTMSVLSTPKPSLRPFFTTQTSGLDVHDIPSRVSNESSRYSDESSKRNDSDSHPENLTDHEHSDPQQQAMPGSPPQDESKKPDNNKTTAVPLFTRDRSISLKEKKVKKETKERRNSFGNVEGMAFPKSICKALLMEIGYKNAKKATVQRTVSQEPRKVLLEQLQSVLGNDDELPDSFILVSTADGVGQLLAQKLQEAQFKVICACSKADVKATVSHFVTKLQKYCNTNSKTPAPVKICIIGGDGFINSVLRPYVEQFSSKSPDWQSYIRFYIVPVGASLIGKFISAFDNQYHTLFGDALWKDAFDKSDNQKTEMFEIVNRIKRYLSSAGTLLQLPIAEAMVTYKEKSTDDESSQIFIPFLNEVRIGPTDLSQSTSVDFDEATVTSPGPSGSPPNTSYMEKAKDTKEHTPPNSPSINNVVASTSQGSPSTPTGSHEYMDLQLDYWSVTPKYDQSEKEKDKDKSKKDSSKSSLKTAFKCVQVFRLPQAGSDLSSSSMVMMVIAKEKKQKIMRIGKKSKESESKSQVIDGINRLICTSKSQSNPLKVKIDGIDWAGVKFFQLSSQWQTHIKHFPVAIFSHSEI